MNIKENLQSEEIFSIWKFKQKNMKYADPVQAEFILNSKI